MSLSRLNRAGLLALTSLLFLPVFAAAQTVSDSTFANADWTLTVSPGGNGGTVVASQGSSGGNFFRSVGDTVNAHQSIIVGTHIYNPFTYDPGISGPILTIDYSEDAFCQAGCFGQGQSTGPAVLQDGILYIYTGFLITGPALTTQTLTLNGLTAADFGRVVVTGTTYFDNTQQPNFSAAGGPIQFGFFRANGSIVSGPYTLTAAIDNWQLVVHAAPTTTSVLSSLNPSTIGQSITFTATVTGGNPTGTVQFRDGATDLGTPITLNSGSAALTTSELDAGTHSITAVYSGDATNAASTSPVLVQTVNAVGPQAIPTLSEWGIVLLGGFLGAAAILRLRGRRSQPGG